MLRDAAGKSIMVEFRDGIDLPAIGESIEAAGIPVTDLYRIHLDEAVWKKSDAIAAQQGKTVDMPLGTLFRIFDPLPIRTPSFVAYSQAGITAFWHRSATCALPGEKIARGGKTKIHKLTGLSLLR